MEKNRRVNQNIEVVIMDKDDSKKKSKLKKALKIAGGVGALGVLGAGTAIAGDALNLWDLGEVGGVAGKVLSPLDKAGNALNAMASAPTVNQLNKKYQKLVDDVTKTVLSHDQGRDIVVSRSFGKDGKFHGLRVGTESPAGRVDFDLIPSFRVENYRNKFPTNISKRLMVER